jgi:hypothetical protein
VYYQQKILADQPLSYFQGAECGYLSLISDSQRDLTSWSTASTGSPTFSVQSSFTQYTDSPTDSITNRVYLSATPSAGTVTLTSPTLSKKLRQLYNKQTINVGVWVYVPSNKTDSITIKYQWNDGTWRTKSAVIPVPSIAEAQWVFFSHSFDMTDSNPVAMVMGNYDQRIAFEIAYSTPGASGAGGDYDYLFNGITVGQGAENFASYCMGQTGAYTVESLHGGDGFMSIYEYGGRLTAATEGIPLHYGIAHSTLLNPWIPERPSVSISKSGFMSESNKTKAMTLEFWLRVAKASNKPVRIVGPEGSRDGLYIHRTTLILSMSGTEAGYDIGTIDYPMLLHWTVSSSDASVMLNGDVIISIQSPPDTSYFSPTTKIGFYTDREIHPVHIASIATYAYSVPSLVAKIRFVRGQGTLQYGLIADQFDGKSFSADFSTSNFAYNLSFPDNMKWKSGSLNNLVATDKIELPNYQLPLIINESQTESWYEKNADMLSTPSTATTYGDTTVLDHTSNYVTGTPFTNTVSDGSVYTTVSSASNRISTISLAGIKPNARFRVYGEGKFAGATPYLTVTFVGPNTTYTTNFVDDGNGRYVAEAEYDVPSNATDIRWGIAVGAGLTFGQFDNVYSQFSYDRQPWSMIPTGYDTEPTLQWSSLNFLNGDRVASITANMLFEESNVDAQLMTIRKRGTNTKLDVYLDSGVVYYEYSDYKQSTVLRSFSLSDNVEFTIGVAINEFLTEVPEAALLFAQPAEVEVAVGGTGFTGVVYDVSFHNGWHHEHSNYTNTNGIVDPNQRTPEESAISTYTLVAVTEFGNFTLDVACSGYWQESTPLSFFMKEVGDRYGSPTNRIDFIQATVGKTRAAMDYVGEAPITYFQLKNNYWGRAYSSMTEADYAALASTTYPYYDPSGLDVQTWVSMQKLSDEIIDYSTKTAATVYDSPVVYLDDDGTRSLVQDGYSIVVPYTYDLAKYVLVSYHLVQSTGVRSNPTKLKSYELASWASDGDRWTSMVSKEGNDVSPYVSNGSYFVYEYPNIFEVTKRGYNYLYKSNRSGYKPRTNDLPGYNSGFVVQWNRFGDAEGGTEARGFAGYSMFIHTDGVVAQEQLITRVVVGSEELFSVYLIPVNDSQFTIEARDSYGSPYTNLQWYVAGDLVANPVFNALEWYMLQCSLVVPHDADSQTVNLMMTGKQMSYDNITIHGILDAVVRGVTVYQRWSDLITQNWQYWATNTDDWHTLYDVGTVISIDIERERMARTLTGVAPDPQFSATVGANMQETFVIRDIEWATMDVVNK